MSDSDMPRLELAAAMRREIRWRILNILNTGRPLGVVETLIFSILRKVELSVTPSELRRELAYLEDMGLVRIPERDAPSWVAHLTAHGINVVEYETAAPEGIARPARWAP